MVTALVAKQFSCLGWSPPFFRDARLHSSVVLRLARTSRWIAVFCPGIQSYLDNIRSLVLGPTSQRQDLG